MVSLEVKNSFSYSLRKFIYHVIFIILIIFIDSRKCFPRVMDKNYGGMSRRSPKVISEINDNNRIIDKTSWFLKHRKNDENLQKPRNEKFEKEYDHQNLKVISEKRLPMHRKQEMSSQDKKFLFSETNGAIHEHLLNHTEKESSLNEKHRDFDRLLSDAKDGHPSKFRTDDKPTDRVTSNDLSNMKIMDYFFSNDATDSESRRKHRNQGIIINLKGLIPLDDTETEKWSSSTTYREVKSSNNDELLAFKAFEIDASQQPELLPTSPTEDNEENINGVIDISEMTSRVGFIEEKESATRNLSRKRRHWSEDEEDDEHNRRRYFRRRRRKRKRRHRHSKIIDDIIEESDIARLPLKSHSPAYVITSAKELKKDWCRTVPLKQRIEEKNCKPKIISNNFCYGQCNSFFIPHQGRTGNTAAAFQSCAFCKPNKQRWINVTLHCPGQTPNKIDKRILFVESCRCMSEVLQ